MQVLSHISKEYGNSPTLGQEFTQAITETILSKSNLCTMLRVSMVAANLSTNRVVDGVSKLITKTDVASFKAKKFQEKLLQVEQFLARTIRHKSFQKAAIRTILALLAKEKLGREPNHQHNHQQIRDAMLKVLQQQPNYIPRSKINDEPKEPASKSCGTLVNLDQSKDAMFVASQSLAIQVGSTYTHKDFPAKVWELVESNQEGVKLAHKPLFQPQQTIVVKAHEIQASMKASKAKPLEPRACGGQMQDLHPVGEVLQQPRTVMLLARAPKVWNPTGMSAQRAEITVFPQGCSVTPPGRQKASYYLCRHVCMCRHVCSHDMMHLSGCAYHVPACVHL